MERIKLETVSGKKAVTINSPGGEEIMSNGIESKLRHKATIESGSREKQVRLVERKNIKTFGPDYASQWQLFRNAGLPVVPTLRKTERGTVMMTDLTADGSEIYGKDLSSMLLQGLFQFSHIDKNKLPKIKYVNSFLEIMEGEEFERLKRKVKEYQELANTNGILLPTDDPFELIIHPDGTWELVIIDLRFGGKDIANPRLSETIELMNKNSAAFFINDLLEIKKFFLKRRIN